MTLCTAHSRSSSSCLTKLWLVALLVTHAAAFIPHKQKTRIKERDHRHLSDLHKHAPVHTRWRPHEYEDHCEEGWKAADKDADGQLTFDEFNALIAEVVRIHRKDSAGTESEPKLVHFDDVYNAFDADGNGIIEEGPEEHTNDHALFLANMWLAQSEMAHEHEETFLVRHPESLETINRVHRKRYHAFDPYDTLQMLEEYTDVDHDEKWSKKELGDSMDYIVKHHHMIGRSVIRHGRSIYRHLDLNKDGKLSKKEVVETRRVDDIEQYIEQECLRQVMHETEERGGFVIDHRRFDYLDEADSEL